MITITTRPMVSSMVRLTSWIAWRIEIERSFSRRICTEAGICAASLGSMARIASTVATVLAPGWRITCSRMALVPLTALVSWVFSMLSCTVAKSDRRTCWPLREAITSALKSSAFIRPGGICSVIIWRRLSNCPSGAFELAAFSAALTSARVRSRAASRSGSTSMRTA